MIVFLLAYMGGVLTIVSPCILPVLPFVFARSDRPFLRSGLPMLAGMAVTFAAIATLAAVAGGWAVEANQYGRDAALVLLALFGLALLFPSFADRAMQPVVALGARLSQSVEPGDGTPRATVLPSLLLGVATGLLWAPCAGPVLGLILTGAALNGASVETSLLLLVYAAGAATSLALALLVGGRVFAAMKRSLGVGEWVRRGLGAAVLVAVVAIALGLDTGLLTQISTASTASLEQGLLDRFGTPPNAEPASSVIVNGGPGAMTGGPGMMMGGPGAMTGGPGMMMKGKPAGSSDDLPIEGALPSLSGAVEWLNSPPLTADGLKGKVVLIDFWTYSCINCLRAIPYVRAWADKYKDQGLVVIGVHAPEFAFEKNLKNVRTAVTDLKIDYPVAIDNDYAIWRAFDNHYWPAHYFIDAAGRIRHHHFGEGDYAESERVIQQLLAEAGKSGVSKDIVAVNASGAEAAADMNNVGSPETYVGYDRAENFISPGGAVEDMRHVYAVAMPRLNEWALSGDWTIGKEDAVLNEKGGSIIYRFHARDLHLVLGPAADGKPVRFRVTIDGAAPGMSHGADVDAGGAGVVTGQRLYQLVRQSGTISDQTFEIQFLDPGVAAYAFTFG
jgi:cytochrome c biogenesis protein CcdA/thiol-disulfide isomerase/thioredoxin